MKAVRAREGGELNLPEEGLLGSLPLEREGGGEGRGGGCCSGLGLGAWVPFFGETGGCWIYSGPVGSRGGAAGPRRRGLNPPVAVPLAEKNESGEAKRCTHHPRLRETATEGRTEGARHNEPEGRKSHSDEEEVERGGGEGG